MKNTKDNDNSSRVEIICTAVIACFSAFFVCYQITDGDIFWHLAAGREMVLNKHFIFTDPFSYSMPNREWIDVHWIFQIVSFLIMQLAGEKGLIISNCILYGVTIGFLYASVRLTKYHLIILPLLIVFVGQLRYLNPIRPTMFTMFFMAIFISVLERSFSKQEVKYLYILPFVQIIWVNCQGLFLIGPVMLLSYCTGEWINEHLYKKRSGSSNVSSYKRVIHKGFMLVPIIVLVNLINPYGIRVFGFAYQLLQRIIPYKGNLSSAVIDENTPLFQFAQPQTTEYSFLLLIFLLIICVMIVATWKRLQFSHLILLIIFSVLSIIAKRNLVLLFCIMVPALKCFAQNYKIPENRVNLLTISIVTIILPIIIMTTFVHLRFVKLVLEGLVVAPFSFPEKGSELLRKINIEGNVFNADRYGGYLIWNNYPEKKVYIDTRLSMRPADYFNNYLDLFKNPNKFDNFAENNNISSVILPIACTDFYTNFAGFLYNNKMWKLIYTDGCEVFFVKENSTSLPGLRLDLITKESMRNEILKRYKNSDVQKEGVNNLDRLYSML
jgi:hypothetical protein